MTGAQYDAMIRLGVDASESLKTLTQQLQTVSDTMEKSLQTSAKKGGKSLKEETSKGVENGVQTGVKKSDSALANLGKQIKNRISLTIAQGIINVSTKAFRDAIDNVIELDKAQTELKKVSDLAGQSLNEFTNQAYDMGLKVAKTGTEIVQASTEFVKMGQDTKTALQLSEYATRLQNIADTEIDAAQAAKFINSQLKAFGKSDAFNNLTTDAEKAEYAIDAVNNVANNFGVGTNDLQMALTKVGAAMNNTGNTFSQSIGLITAGTEVMPGQASKVGRGLRTLALNLSKLRDENESLTTSNGDVNISLRDEEGQVKNLYQVLQELYNGNAQGSKAWKDLGQEERDAIGITLAGKTQYEVLSSVLENYTSAIEAASAAEYEQANGSSRRENERYLDSIEGKIANFQSAWEQLSYHLVNSDFLKNFIDIGTDAITILDALVEHIGVIPTLLTGISLSSIPKLLFQSFNQSIKQWVKSKVIQEELVTATTEAVKSTSMVLTGASSSNFLGDILFNKFNEVKVTKRNLPNKTNAFKSLTKDFDLLVNGNQLVIDKTQKYEEELNKLRTVNRQIFDEELNGLDIVNGKKVETIEGTKKRIALLKKEQKQLKQSTNIAEAELNEVKDQTSQAASNLNGSLMALGATAALIALAIGLKKIGDYISFESRIKQLDKLNDALQTNADRIDELNQKKKSNGLSKEEERELALLKLENEQLEKQIELKKEQIQLAFTNEAKAWNNKGGKASESNVDYSSIYASRKAEEAKLTAEYNQAIEDGERNRAATINRQLQKIVSLETDAVKEIQSAYDNLEYVNYKDLDADGREYFRNIVSGYLTTVTSVEEYRNAIEDLPKKAILEISAVDVNGTLQQTEISVKDLKSLTDKELELFINAQQTGDWSKVEKYLTKNKLGEGNAFYNLAVKFTTKNENNVEAQANKLSKDRDVKFKAKLYGSKKAQNKIDELAKDREVKLKVKTVEVKSDKSKKDKDATGKRKGEKGGMSWLGDEGSVQNPAPELVVGEDGAYLAGTSGWELYNLKSSDTVYTATQTKKLLANNSFQGSVGELPRYAKGKFAKSDSKASKKSANKMETWEYQLSIGVLTQAQYIAKLKKLVKQTKKITKDQYRDLKQEIFEYNQDKEEAVIEEYATEVKYGKMSYEQLKAYIQASKKLTDEAKQDLIKEAQEAEAEWLQTKLELGMIDFDGFYAGIQALDKLEDKAELVETAISSIIDAIEDGGGQWGSFEAAGQAALDAIASSIDTLGAGQIASLLSDWEDSILSATSDKYEEMLDRAEMAQEVYKTVAQHNIDALQAQMDALDEVNDAQETQNELLEAEAALAQAKAKRVRVWQAGVGWVYKEDTAAVKEAQQNLNEIKKDAQKQVLQNSIDEWNDYLNDIEDQYDYDLLLSKLGWTDEEAQELAGNSIYLTDTFKSNYEQVLANCNAYEQELYDIENLNGIYGQLDSQVQALTTSYAALAQVTQDVAVVDAAEATAIEAQEAADAAVAERKATYAAYKEAKSNGQTKKAAKLYAEWKEDKAAAQEAKAEAKAAAETYETVKSNFEADYGMSTDEALDKQEAATQVQQNNTEAAASTVTNKVNNYASKAYASGTTSASGGFSWVGENGPEIRMLNQGDAIFSNAASKNLMALSQYTPAQLASLAGNDSHNVILNVQQGAIVVEGATGDGTAIAQEIVTQLERKATQMSYRRTT